MRSWTKGNITLYHGDCRELQVEGVTAIVTDPPYGLNFMGKGWDRGVPGVDFWEHLRRLCLPGAPLFAFGGTRTQHRMVCAIEDSGWEICNQLYWLYGSGFPKGGMIDKQIDKKYGAKRDVIGTKLGQPGYSLTDGKGGLYGSGIGANGTGVGECDITAPATEDAKMWAGWASGLQNLKPAAEPICYAQAPRDGTYVANALKHGVAGLNIDACRVPYGDEQVDLDKVQKGNIYWDTKQTDTTPLYKPGGRWPANVVHDGSKEVTDLCPDTKPSKANVRGQGYSSDGSNPGWKRDSHRGFASVRGHEDSGGSAARFFYCAKASKKDKGPGNTHPTAKPTALMEYLVKLVTMPQNNLILDPFMGSGTTGVVCARLGLPFIGVELEQESYETAIRRIDAE